MRYEDAWMHAWMDGWMHAWMDVYVCVERRRRRSI
jgi:hypothetical protein